MSISRYYPPSSELEREALTDDMITTLQAEAGSAGDTEMVAACTAALERQPGARQRCADVINYARGEASDGRPYRAVRV